MSLAAPPVHTQIFSSSEIQQHLTAQRGNGSIAACCTCSNQARLCDCVPSACSAGLAEGCSARETSEPPAPAVLALQGLNSALSFMRSYSLILARALSK